MFVSYMYMYMYAFLDSFSEKKSIFEYFGRFNTAHAWPIYFFITLGLMLFWEEEDSIVKCLVKFSGISELILFETI